MTKKQHQKRDKLSCTRYGALAFAYTPAETCPSLIKVVQGAMIGMDTKSNGQPVLL